MKNRGETLVEVVIALALMMLLTFVLAPVLKSPLVPGQSWPWSYSRLSFGEKDDRLSRSPFRKAMSLSIGGVEGNPGLNAFLRTENWLKNPKTWPPLVPRWGHRSSWKNVMHYPG